MRTFHDRQKLQGIPISGSTNDLLLPSSHLDAPLQLPWAYASRKDWLQQK